MAGSSAAVSAAWWHYPGPSRQEAHIDGAWQGGRCCCASAATASNLQAGVAKTSKAAADALRLRGRLWLLLLLLLLLLVLLLLLQLLLVLHLQGWRD